MIGSKSISETEQKALNRDPAVIGEVRSSFAVRPEIWRGVSEADWASFEWQWAHRVMTETALDEILTLTEDERAGIRAFASTFSLCLSPHYLALMVAENDVAGPIRRQGVPSMAETQVADALMDDPLGEARHTYFGCATRRYPDRVLIYTTHECAMRCRHCTRRCKVGQMQTPTEDLIMASIDAVCANTQIRDVLLSGGDVLALPTPFIEKVVARLRACEHIDVIRIGTRMPCTLPQRLNDDALLRVFERYAPLYVNTQFNHPNEASLESELAFRRLRAAGCILGNQSVLLRGVNEAPEAHEALNRWLVRHGCRPYYLFLCDVAQGTSHFRTPVQTGLNIMTHLRGRLSGLAIPHFVVDLPDGMGKVDLAPERMKNIEGTQVVRFTNWFGAEVDYQ